MDKNKRGNKAVTGIAKAAVSEQPESVTKVALDATNEALGQATNGMDKLRTLSLSLTVALKIDKLRKAGIL